MSKAATILREFREFAVRGNMVDLAVGVIVGAAFGKIVESLVKDIVMPVINFLVGGTVDFSNKFIVLHLPDGYTGPQTYADLTKAGATILAWGNFATIVINFVLLAFVIFWMVKGINSTRAKLLLQTPPPPPTPEAALLTEIRDLLKQRSQ
jgi:large conductance mechanosensitive channel